MVEKEDVEVGKTFLYWGELIEISKIEFEESIVSIQYLTTGIIRLESLEEFLLDAEYVNKDYYGEEDEEDYDEEDEDFNDDEEYEDILPNIASFNWEGDSSINEGFEKVEISKEPQYSFEYDDLKNPSFNSSEEVLNSQRTALLLGIIK